MARTLISVFEAHVHRKRGDLTASLRSCEELGYNYKLVRGLSAVLEDRCVFEIRARVEPAEARRAAFDEAGRAVVATEEARSRALAAAAFRLGVSSGDLDSSLYADLWDEQALARFDGPSPLELLREYNFSLSLAILTAASRLEMTYKGVDDDLELLVGELGGRGGHTLDGLSRLTFEHRPTKRTGRDAAALEALLSRLLLKEGWSLAADVSQTSRAGKINLFELSKNSDGGLVTPSDLKRRSIAGTRARAEPAEQPPIEMVVVDEMASKLGVTEAEVMQRLKGSGRCYVDLGGVLVTPDKLRELEEALAAAPDMELTAVAGLLRRLGCRRPLPVLEALGYSVEWAGDRERSRVYKLRGRRGAK